MLQVEVVDGGDVGELLGDAIKLDSCHGSSAARKIDASGSNPEEHMSHGVTTYREPVQEPDDAQ